MFWNRQRTYVLVITFGVMATIIGIGIIADPLGVSRLSGKSGKPNDAANNGDHRVGAVVFEVDPYSCREVKFDNVTGQFSKSGPCDSSDAESREKTIPIGTFHRLQSIRKSFVGDRQNDEDYSNDE